MVNSLAKTLTESRYYNSKVNDLTTACAISILYSPVLINLILSLSKRIHFFKLRKCLLLIFSAGIAILLNAQTQTFTTTGSGQSFTVPAGVTTIKVECWGGGGAGGQASTSSNGKGGGGGGAYSAGFLNVIPGNNYSLNVGAGGAAGQTTVSNPGGATSFSTLIIATGGINGNNDPALSTGGLGGQLSGCTGTTIFIGGNGGNGNSNTNGGGGGGGSSATNSGNGINGGNTSTSTGAAGGNGLNGDGGNGGNQNNSGLNGTTPGGGGGGRGDVGSVSGNGANGQVIISWIVVSATSTETCIGGSTGTITASAVGGTSYTYSKDGTNYQSSGLFSGLAAGSYNIYAKDAAEYISFTTISVNTPSASTDDQNAAGTNTWVGHVFSGRNADFNTNVYYGHYTQTESFNESFGNGGDNSCFTIYSGALTRSINTQNFSVRYRMNSSKKGFYTVDLGSDDGNKLTVDGTLVYTDWGDHSISSHPGVLMNLNGASNLLYEYYENAGLNQVYFQNLTLVLANNISTNTTQTVLLGNTGTAISGDVFGTLPSGISLSGTGYQWSYSTTPSGTRNSISGATGATFTPNTSTAPFNVTGTYYIYRNAQLSSTNNVSPNPYVATNESNVATITVTGPVITLSTTSLTGFTYPHSSGPSAQQSFTVSGTNLSSNIVITPPQDFEISTTSGSGFQSSQVTLVQSGGTITNASIYIRLKAGLVVGSYTAENIVCSSSGAVSKNVALNGTVTSATYFSIADGNWNTNTTWSLSSGGGAVGSGIYPTAGDIVTIEGGHDVTVTANAACGSITFTTTTATTLSINSGITLNVLGAITIPRTTNSGVNLIAVGAGNLNVGNIAFTSGATYVRHQMTISTGTVTVSGNITTDDNGTSATITFTDAGKLILGGTLFTTPFNGGTLTTVSGSTVIFNALGAQIIEPFTYYNLTLTGSGVKTTTNVTVNGILSMEGDGTVSATDLPNYGVSAALQYKGTATQTTGIEFAGTFSGTGGLIINNPDSVNLSASKTINSLTLSNGILNTKSYILSVSNTSPSSIAGGTATSYINGPVKWTLPASLSSVTTYNFPIGNKSYLPFSLVNPTTGTGTVTAQVQATNGNSGGTFNASLTSLSNTEYWSLVTSGNFTNSSLSLGRQSTITPLFDAIGGSTLLNGQYSALGGIADNYSVSNSSPIGSNRFFVLSKGKALISTNTSSLSGFSYASGYGPSKQLLYFTVSGMYLTTNITVLPTDSFEISLSSGNSFDPQNLITLQVNNGIVGLDTIYVRMKAGFSAGTIVSNYTPILCTSDNAVTKTVQCSGSVTNAPTITVTPTTLSGFYYNVSSGGPSAIQSFMVSGTFLTSNIVITAPTDYLICLTRRGTYVSTLSFTPSGGNVATDSVYVILESGLIGGIYNETISLTTSTSTITVTQNILCYGSVNQPIITLSTFNLGGFIYNQGSGPSGFQSFTVNGNYLTSSLVVTAPTNFQICLNSGGTYGSSVSLTPSGGIVQATTIYVRMSAGLLSTNSPFGQVNVTAVSTGAITQNVTCSGKVVLSGTAAIASSTPTLVGFVYTLGNGPSVVQSFTVSGTSLQSDITVTPSSNFEIRLNTGDQWSSLPLTIPLTGTIVNADSVYIRLKSGLIVANYTTDQVTLATTGATSQTIACTGAVIAAPSITAGPSNLGSTCNGSTVSLTSSGTSNVFWSGPNNFYSTDPNPSLGAVSSVNAGTYTVTGVALSPVNLLTNGSFEQLNTGFGSSYTYVDPSPTALSTGGLPPDHAGEGLYTITGIPNYLTPDKVHSQFSPCAAKAGTKQMVVNGATSNGIIAWSESVSVVPGANYQFSYWIQTVNTLGTEKYPAQMQLYVNGIPAGQVYTSSETVCSWIQFVYNTNSGSNSVLQLTLINKNIVPGGNDFSLDDIWFQQSFQVSSSVTLTVNPNLPVSVSISASNNPIYSGIQTTFTAAPVNGGTSPSYQWKVNGNLVGTNSPTYSYTPVTGDKITCILTSNAICTSGSPATSNQLTAVTSTNFWYGGTSTDWGDPTNWTRNMIPSPGNDVIFASTSNDYHADAVRNLVLDQNRTIGSLANATTRTLLIPAGKGLIVNNTITTDGNPDRIYIYSSSSGANGSLIFHNSSAAPVNANVEMYTLAYYDPNGVVNNKYHWQYFGIPLNTVVAEPTFYNSYVRNWNEAGTAISNHWVSLVNSSVLQPFYGYEITQKNPVTILFRGQLVNSNFNPPPLSVTSTALYPGQHIYANPYTAAIDIRQLSFGSDTEATVYLYNTGTYNQWQQDSIAKNPSGGSIAGQYTVIPKNIAGSGGLPRQIPSMQGLLVKVLSTASTINSTFGISYNNVVLNNTDRQRAPGIYKDSVSGQVSTLIEVTGTNYSDRMWLFTQPGCTHNFDNGWDGTKILGNSLAPQIFAVEPDGNYQVDAVDNINNTQLGFQAGADQEYTFTFTHQNLKNRYDGMYLFDELENKAVEITESGSTYSFSAPTTTTIVNRFMIAICPYETDASKNASNSETQLKVFCSGNTIFVQNFSNLSGEFIEYDMMGRAIKKAKFNPLGVTAFQNETIPGAYIIHAATSADRISKRIILQ